MISPFTLQAIDIVKPNFQNKYGGYDSNRNEIRVTEDGYDTSTS